MKEEELKKARQKMGFPEKEWKICIDSLECPNRIFPFPNINGLEKLHCRKLKKPCNERDCPLKTLGYA